jgi:hypothetical protein
VRAADEQASAIQALLLQDFFRIIAFVSMLEGRDHG